MPPDRVSAVSKMIGTPKLSNLRPMASVVSAQAEQYAIAFIVRATKHSHQIYQHLATAFSYLRSPHWQLSTSLDVTISTKHSAAVVEHMVQLDWPHVNTLVLTDNSSDSTAMECLAQGSWPKLVTLDLSKDQLDEAAITLSAGPMQSLQTDHATLCLHAGKERQTALDEFYEQWKDDSLVILKWLGIQTGSNIKGNLQNVQQLLEHPAVNINNPNTCYSTFLGFARSPVNFHAQDGSGYRFMADSTLKVKCIFVRGDFWCCCVIVPAWHVGHCAPKATLLFIC